MIIVKYRMTYENGYIETLSLEDAQNYGNYIIIEEEVIEDELPIITE